MDGNDKSTILSKIKGEYIKLIDEINELWACSETLHKHALFTYIILLFKTGTGKLTFFSPKIPGRTAA